MMTYQQAKLKLQGARDPTAGKPIANNTRLIARGADIAVRFHETDVVTIHKSGAYTLNTGGWRSMTAAARINKYAPAGVYSDRGIWWYGCAASAKGVPFKDGCKLKADGTPFKYASQAHVTRERRLRAEVKAYAAEYIRRLHAGELEPPSGGDCWGCLMATDKGEYPMGGDCVRGHVKERYYVPSLIIRVLKTRGYGPLHLQNAAHLLKVPGMSAGYSVESFRKDYTRALRRFCLQQCGLAY